MADHVVMPPVPNCPCAFCLKRRWELQLAARMERELLEAVERDLHGKRLTVMPEETPDTPVKAAAKRPWRDRRRTRVTALAARTFQSEIWGRK